MSRRKLTKSTVLGLCGFVVCYECKEKGIKLMYVHRPVMNGYEATKQIRALDEPALAKITILAMTANAFDEDRKRALECGMNGFLSKPIVIEELICALQNNLKNL